MDYFEPSPDIVPFVTHYAIARWGLPEGEELAVADVLSQPVVQILFAADGARAMGVMKRRRNLVLKGNGVYAVIRFKPGGFHAFWQGSMAELTERTVPLSEAGFVPPGDLLTLQDHEIAERMDSLLLDKHPRPDHKIQLVNEVIAKVEADRNMATVRAVSEAFDMSERTLQELFMTYVGVGVKWVIMRIRFLDAIEQAHGGSKPNWTIVAAELGYSTQSHFNNDFKKIMGETPSEYIKTIR